MEGVLLMETHGFNDVVLAGGGCHRSKTKSQAVEAAELDHLRQGIEMLMKRWTGLQMALQNEWGGHDSRQKYDQLIVDLLFYLSRSKGPASVEELESYLHESMLLSFNTEMEDGSIELVAEHLVIIHEDYLQGCLASTQTSCYS